MSYSNSWYVAVDDLTAGPAATELVIRGIEHRKIPPEAQVCQVGAGRWEPLASVDAFHAAVIRSYPPPPPDSEEARHWMAHGFHFPPLAALPRFEYPLDVGHPEARPSEPLASDDAPQAIPAERERSRDSFEDAVLMDDAEIDVDCDDVGAASLIDWRDPFESFFLIGDEVELPEEQTLLESLAVASRETFRDEGALWNLALCLAYGSDEVGAAAARAFFEAVADQGDADHPGGRPGASAEERLEWMRRTLQGNGFVPSGIPREAGQRAVRRLRSSCPPSLTGRLS